MWKTYLIAGVIGLIYGVAVGGLKYAVLWRTIIKTQREITSGVLTKRMLIGYAINIATLLFVFILRNVIPLDYMWLLIGTAVGLTLMSKLLPISKVMDCVKTNPRDKSPNADNDAGDVGETGNDID